MVLLVLAGLEAPDRPGGLVVPADQPVLSVPGDPAAQLALEGLAVLGVPAVQSALAVIEDPAVLEALVVLPRY